LGSTVGWLEGVNLDASVLLNHFKDVSLKLVRDLGTQNKCSIFVLDDGVEIWVCVDVRLLVVRDSLQTVERHANEFILQKKVVEVLEILANAVGRHWDLPEIALDQIRMSLHHISDLLVFFL
jgi:hypothetical protein